jgi:phosphopantetheinyl transferase
MIGWFDGIAGWDRSLPAVIVAVGVTIGQRRPLLHALVVRAMSINPDAVVIEHREGSPPTIAKPLGSGLHLSVGSRGFYTAAAIAASPIGVDVELLDERGQVPWNVLHEREAAFLAGLAGHDRALAFARMWSLKEAYLKALGAGLRREPASFAVSFVGGERAAIDDPHAAAEVADARTTWRAAAGAWNAVSAVVLAASADQ